MKKILLSLTLFISVAGYSQVTKLALKKGQKFEVTMINKLNSIADVMGQSMENTMENTIVEVYEVKEVTESAIELQKTLIRVKGNMLAMAQEMSYDSDDKNTGGPMTETISAMVGKEKNLQIDLNGKITRQAEMDEKEAALMGQFGAMGQQMGISILNPALINQNLESGKTWLDSSLTEVDQLKTKASGRYSLLSKDGSRATFQYEGTQQMEGIIEQMGQSMSMKGSTNIKSTMVVNISNGLISEGTSTSEGTSDIEAMGMNIPTKVKSSITTTVKAL